MREAIGGTWLFQIVIVFILLFTGFMCLTINRTKAFHVKDQIIQAIQDHNGIDLSKGYTEDSDDAYAEIISYIKENSYRTTGKVPASEVINGEKIDYYCFDRNGKSLNGNTNTAVFCLAEVSTKNNAGTSFNELPEMRYYRVIVFYQLDLPIFKSWFNFKIVGDTKTLMGDVL